MIDPQMVPHQWNIQGMGYTAYILHRGGVKYGICGIKKIIYMNQNHTRYHNSFLGMCMFELE